MRVTIIAAFILAAALPAAAQDRPFMFSIATVTKDEPAVRFDYDVGVGEHAFQSDTSNQPEQRIGVHASYKRLLSSGAFRDLPPDTNRTSYAFKASFSISLVSTH